MGFHGIYSIPLTILGKTVMHHVWVCDEITDLNVSIDFNQAHKYDCLSRSVHCDNQPHAPNLNLKAVTTFEPLTTTLITTTFLGKTEPSAPHVASILLVEDELIQGGPALVTVTNGGLCTVAVTSCTPYP